MQCRRCSKPNATRHTVHFHSLTLCNECVQSIATSGAFVRVAQFYAALDEELQGKKDDFRANYDQDIEELVKAIRKQK